MYRLEMKGEKLELQKVLDVFSGPDSPSKLKYPRLVANDYIFVLKSTYIEL